MQGVASFNYDYEIGNNIDQKNSGRRWEDGVEPLGMHGALHNHCGGDGLDPKRAQQERMHLEEWYKTFRPGLKRAGRV